ncbi:MOG interacting and ectopic P-granules protein 1 [Dendroctonus ponderosae]|uniref:MOG interacting and ectopic P-granules protein 1 n=1 Tax=Dendroctonus ponderosae TaxID=77166 RepID=UPI0020364EA5|nr:MOG interacting and ectopic P-granules protein 1 [Dendroctonus ponderosae]
MAKVLTEMGEVDEVNSNEDGVLLNGSAMEVDSVDKSLPDAGSDIKDASLDSKDGETESSREDATSQSAMDEDSQDSQDSHASQESVDGKSQSSQDSQDSNMEADHVPEENGSLGEDVAATNGCIPPAEDSENSNTSSEKNEEDSRSSGSRAPDQDPLNDEASENSQDGTTDADKKSENGEKEVAEEPSAELVPIPSAITGEVTLEKLGKSETVKGQDTIELNSEDEGDVLFVNDSKTNGTEVIDLVESPEKSLPDNSDKAQLEAAAPRRSSRNVNKSRSYVEENEKEDTPPPARPAAESEESDIEEVLPQDPLAVNDQITVERIPSIKKKQTENSSTIVVKDTKRLVEIASKSSPSHSTHPSGKKEPTLVIIDTNAILSGRGAVPVPSKSSQSLSSSNFASVLPVAVPAQGMYPANMRATITPIPSSGSSKSSPIMASSLQPATPPLLPTLTDDMFVVEAPSFIVPYVYEKPPVKVLKEFVVNIKKMIQSSKQEKRERKERKDKGDKAKDDADSDTSYSSEEDSEEEKAEVETKKSNSYFESPLGKFFMDIGFNMVQEYVQSDLLKQQKRKRDREQGANPETNKTISSLIKNIEMSKGNNEHFKMEIKKCEFCNFKTESKLAMSYHLETPHMKNFVYKCNFCVYEVRSPHDILFHMEAEHAVRGHLERAPAFHQCPSCPFEDNQKGKLSRHLVVCARKFKPDRNLEPPPDWEPPAKIPRMPKMRATGLNATVAAYQTLAANKGAQQYQFLSKMHLQANAASSSALNRGRGRPSLGPNVKGQSLIRPQGMIFKQQSGGQVLVPANYQLSGSQVFQTSQVSGQQHGKKPSNTPSISITPLPRGTSATPTASKPGDTSSKNSFVICEICDGYIKDLEQLRNHMQWIHKIKIHPKMIYNRPPLNCQKCQFRFFTDQGLERHLLGSHGLVTSSMQDAANKSKDSGRCPVCGRVYQWKLLNHVARDHNMTLKPAHLSYKCTVCTATFGMYKQFENHVYSAHSVVAKRVMDKKTTSTAAPSGPKNAELKPLKINDEITIIPQPPKSTNGASKESSSAQKNAPSTSKNDGDASTSSRAERFARRNAGPSDVD